MLLRLMSPEQQLAHFEKNTARAMGDAPIEVKLRHIGNCAKADPAYGKGVDDVLSIPMSEVRRRTGEACGLALIHRRVQNNREASQEPPRRLARETVFAFT